MTYSIYSGTNTGYTYTTTVPISNTTSNTITWGANVGSISVDPNIKGGTLQVKGTAEFDSDVKIVGDLIVKGKSLKESLDQIEEKLAILHPNPELEDRWEDLKRLRQEYMELEAELLDKEKMWAILKK